jgi:hypothetical protein
MRDNTMYEAVMPQAVRRRVAWLNISTPSDKDDCLFNMLMKNGVIRTMTIDQACKQCVKAGDAENCNHLIKNKPWWHDEENYEFLKTLYVRRRVQFQREMQAHTSSSRPECFDEQKVHDAFTRPPIPLGGASRPHVFVAIDPAHGSLSSEKRGSDTAVVSITKHAVTIVGAEAIDVTGKAFTWENFIVRHCELLLRIPELVNALLVVIIEGNHGGVMLGGLMNKIEERFPGRVIFMNNKPPMIGVEHDHETKREMMQALQLAFHQENVQIADCFVTQHEKPLELKKDMMGQ